MSSAAHIFLGMSLLTSEGIALLGKMNVASQLEGLNSRPSLPITASTWLTFAEHG